MSSSTLIASIKTQSKKNSPRAGTSPNKEVVKTVRWYHGKGMDPNSVYGMLTRMNVPAKDAYKAVYDEFYKGKK